MSSLTIRLREEIVRIPINRHSKKYFETRHKGQPSYSKYLQMILKGKPATVIAKIYGVTAASVYLNHDYAIKPHTKRTIKELRKEILNNKMPRLNIFASLHKSTKLVWREAIKHRIKPEPIVYRKGNAVRTRPNKLTLNGILCKIHFITAIRRPSGNNPYAVTTITPNTASQTQFHIFVFVNNKHRPRIFIIPSSHINCETKYRSINLPLAEAQEPRHKYEFPVVKNPAREYEDAWHYLLRQ